MFPALTSSLHALRPLHAGGFCCTGCGGSSRVRPILLQQGPYQRYVHYSQDDEELRSEGRGEGRRQRRQTRKKLEAAEAVADAVASGERPRDLLRAVQVLEKAAADPEAGMRGRCMRSMSQ